MELDSKQRLFAMLVAKGSDSFEAALEVHEDRMDAVDVYMDWQKDPDIKAYISELKKEESCLRGESESSGDSEFDAFRKECLEMFRSRQLDPDSRLRAGKMYAEVSGYIKKADTVTNVQVNNNKNPVMVLYRSEDDKQWANKLADNQKRLMENNEPVEVEIEDVG